MNRIQFLTMQGCQHCEGVRRVFDEIMTDFPHVELKEVDMVTEEGQKLVQKYSVMAAPGIIINGELFSTGGVDKESLIQRLQSLQ